MTNPPASTGITGGLRRDLAARDAEIAVLLSEISERDDVIAYMKGEPDEHKRLTDKIAEQAKTIRHLEQRIRKQAELDQAVWNG